MEIKSLKELEMLMQMCAKRGVKSIKIDNIEFHIQDGYEAPTKRAKTAKRQTPNYYPGVITEDTRVEMPDVLTDEQLIGWSTGPQN
jgi:5'-3' exonuclease